MDGRMLRAVIQLLTLHLKLVRLLPFGALRMKKRDFRIICDCQRHALHERTILRRSARAVTRAANHVRRNGIAFLVGVPLAFGAIGIPIEAMNTAAPAATLRQRFAAFETFASRARSFRVITPRVRQDFLSPDAAPRTLSVETAKEAFFSARVPYGSIIYREAKKNHLAPELVAAVVEAESDFRVRLVSQKSATGLMQIVPETGRLLGVDDLFNPDENIAAGTKYLRYLIDRFRDPVIALAAYNAGEGTVERCRCVPAYGETQEYIRRVNAHARTYREQVRSSYHTAMRLQPAR
jgi:soluble lytic murein transglycosylase-like protein